MGLRCGGVVGGQCAKTVTVVRLMYAVSGLGTAMRWSRFVCRPRALLFLFVVSAPIKSREERGRAGQRSAVRVCRRVRNKKWSYVADTDTVQTRLGKESRTSCENEGVLGCIVLYFVS